MAYNLINLRRNGISRATDFVISLFHPSFPPWLAPRPLWLVLTAHTPLAGPQTPLAGSHTPLAGSHNRPAGPLKPLANSQAPFASFQASSAGPQTSLGSNETPLASTVTPLAISQIPMAGPRPSLTDWLPYRLVVILSSLPKNPSCWLSDFFCRPSDVLDWP